MNSLLMNEFWYYTYTEWLQVCDWGIQYITCAVHIENYMRAGDCLVITTPAGSSNQGPGVGLISGNCQLLFSHIMVEVTQMVLKCDIYELIWACPHYVLHSPNTCRKAWCFGWKPFRYAIIFSYQTDLMSKCLQSIAMAARGWMVHGAKRARTINCEWLQTSICIQ